VLLDESIPASDTWSPAPRTLSIALWNSCDLGCHFCYRPKNNDKLSPAFVKQVAVAIDKLGALEITFGGGEPLLYQPLAELCDWIWTNTALGTSITSHGHHLSRDLIGQLHGRISLLRFSIDGVEPYYSQIRGLPLSNLLEIIRSIDRVIPFGINVVVSPGHTEEVRKVAELAVNLGACDLLIIPEHRAGKILLGADDWIALDKIIEEYHGRCRLSVTHGACAYLASSFLETECVDEFVFAHISADGSLRSSSYAAQGIPIRDVDKLRDYLIFLRQNRGVF
jgi:MoaA/NifB/PqqE/SkfB family radical SAM enzyme